MSQKSVLITGAAGFVGAHAAARLIADGWTVTGVDNLNPYYDVSVKRARLSQLAPGMVFHEADFSERGRFEEIAQNTKPDIVLHLGAQAGVRYSINNPFAYTRANVSGHLRVLEACRHLGCVERLVYASSSSVYGMATPVPFREDAPIGEPESLYAATKIADELMSATYARLYGLRQIGLRFFTVYGPFGRPDMAYWSFTRKMLAGETIPVFNHGRMRRDFTYIDDVVDGIVAAIDAPVFDQPVPHAIFNLGNNHPETLMDMIRLLERETGKTADLELMPMQPGDVTETYADISKARAAFGYLPAIDLATGLRRFVSWFTAFHG